MDEFLSNILSLGWWLNHVPAALVAIAVTWAVKNGKSVILSFMRYQKLRELRKIKSKRFNFAAVTYDVVKTHCLMVLFIGLCVFYASFFVGRGSENTHWLVIIVQSIPLYVVEILYLNQRSFTKALVESVGKVRITKQARRTL